MDQVAAAIDELTAMTEDDGPAIIVGAPMQKVGYL